MRTFLTWLFFVCMVGLKAQNMRERISLNQNWKFEKGHAANPEKDFNYGLALSFSKINFLQEATMLQQDQESHLAIPHTQSFDDSKWERIDLPHDWGMSLGFDKKQLKIKGYRKLGGRSPENSVGWYRKTFELTPIEGCRYTLEFEGIFRDAQVWMNGIYLGRGESGYVPLFFDVTECLNYGKNEKNVIMVRVDATQSELWSYEGAGIYRNVWLTRTASVHVPLYGTFVMSDIDPSGKNAVVKAAIEVTNESGKDVELLLKNTIFDKQGSVIATLEQKKQIKVQETEEVVAQMHVQNVRLWSLETPVLYKLQTDIEIDGRIVDSYLTPFGIRSIVFDPNNGFMLNGKRVQIQGVCCHQDHAGVGIAVPDRLNVWRIQKLKEFGTNAYRSSHNPPTMSVLDACDTLGMLVMDEMRVMSASDEGLNQLRTIIRRDRNHPSVVIWSLGNEEPAIQGSEKGTMIAKRMKEVQHKLDPTRLCTAAMNGSWGKGFSLAVDVQGSNYYKIGDMDKLHRQLPELPCLLTEEASTLTTRGVYKTQAEKDFHQAYDRDHPGWGATAQEWMRYVDPRKYIGGAFVWTGFDYGGEAHAYFWPGVVSNFGILDYCGYPKDATWFYKAWWTNEPVLHILPHWNGLGTDSIDVHLYTNMDEVELYCNGKSIGRRTLEKYDIPKWKLKYVPGKIVVKGKKGNKNFTEIMETTDKPFALQMLSETGPSLKKDNNDIAIITVKVLDKKGRLVPTADNYIRFNVKHGVIRGIGNGSPSCHEPDVFRQDEMAGRSAFSGYVQLIIAGDHSGEPIEVEAISDGLKQASLKFQVK